MSYCTVNEVESMIKDDMIAQLLGDGYIENQEEKKQRMRPVIENAVEDAEAEIDGYLNKRYPVPLKIVPGVINKFAKDITIYNLMARTGIDEGEREKTFLNRYRDAIKYLTLVSEGKADIGISINTSQGTAATGFKISTSDKLYGRNNLQGM